MIRIVTLVVLYLITLTTTAQTKFEKGMQQAFTLMQENKLDEAANLFERIGNTETKNWLPYYNLALLKTRTTFGMKDNAVIEAQLKNATDFVDKADAISPDNSEIYVLKALINVAKVASNPMVYGASLSVPTTDLYKKAIELNKNNPRAHSGLAEFEMGSARFFKQDLTPFCTRLQESIAIYDTFETESKFHPNWGKDRVLEILKSCGNIATKPATKVVAKIIETTSKSTGTITIKVTVPNITSNKGNVQFGLYSKQTFMQTPLVSKVSEIKEGACTVEFKNVKAGEYAIICFHDLNGNSKMDYDEQMMPLEDYGISNNPMLMGPPTFDAAKFTVENKSLDLTIKF